MSIHHSAIIDSSAHIAPDAIVGPYVVIGPDVRVGPGCKIHSHAVLEFTTLGSNCEVFPFASLGLPAQHLRYTGEAARVEVGNGTVFREGVTVHRGTPFDQSVTRIGNNCFFMAQSHIAHDCQIGNNVTFANSAMAAGHVVVGDNAFVSATVGIHQFVRIGKGVILSGGAMVPLDVAPFCIAQGDRAEIKGLNVVGMRRMGFNREQMKEIKRAFKTVFLEGLRLEEALKRPELNTGSDAVDTFREFLSHPKRGFLRPAGNVTEESEVSL